SCSLKPKLATHREGCHPASPPYLNCIGRDARSPGRTLPARLAGSPEHPGEETPLPLTGNAAETHPADNHVNSAANRLPPGDQFMSADENMASNAPIPVRLGGWALMAFGVLLLLATLMRGPFLDPAAEPDAFARWVTAPIFLPAAFI